MPRVCIHLDRGTGCDYAHYFSGAEVEHALVCLACREDPDGIEANLSVVTPERFAQIEQGGCWDCDKKAIVGRPQIVERPTDLTFEHRDVALAGTGLGGIADLRPIAASGDVECLVLTDEGEVFRVDLGRGSVRRLMSAFDPGVALAPTLSLHASPGGEMAAVVGVRGRHGVVLDLEAGRPAMRLDRGDYRFEHSDFPVAFFERDGHLRLVHGTDWNRLDISDPRAGVLLTDRALTPYRGGEERPAHDLNYFHGGLAVSPGGDWIVDNGWVWHPAGVVTAWSLRRWLGDNPWESEDGPSKKDLCVRSYFWGGPLCWIDGRRLAVWGYGNDDENLIPAALLFDVESGRQIRWFPGPRGSLVFDRHLFSFSADAGTSVWDVATGERLLHDASFCPTAYHPGAGQFVTVCPGGEFRLSRLVGG
jgi:hypothetical protein